MTWKLALQKAMLPHWLTTTGQRARRITSCRWGSAMKTTNNGVLFATKSFLLAKRLTHARTSAFIMFATLAIWSTTWGTTWSIKPRSIISIHHTSWKPCKRMLERMATMMILILLQREILLLKSREIILLTSREIIYPAWQLRKSLRCMFQQRWAVRKYERTLHIKINRRSRLKQGANWAKLSVTRQPRN